MQEGISAAALLQQRGQGCWRAQASRRAEAALSAGRLGCKDRVIAKLILTDNILKLADGSKRETDRVLRPAAAAVQGLDPRAACSQHTSLAAAAWQGGKLRAVTLFGESSGQITGLRVAGGPALSGKLRMSDFSQHCWRKSGSCQWIGGNKMMRGRPFVKGELKTLLQAREPEGWERAGSREPQLCAAESCSWDSQYGRAFGMQPLEFHVSSAEVCKLGLRC